MGEMLTDLPSQEASVWQTHSLNSNSQDSLSVLQPLYFLILSWVILF